MAWEKDFEAVGLAHARVVDDMVAPLQALVRADPHEQDVASTALAAHEQRQHLLDWLVRDQHLETLERERAHQQELRVRRAVIEGRQFTDRVATALPALGTTLAAGATLGSIADFKSWSSENRALYALGVAGAALVVADNVGRRQAEEEIHRVDASLRESRCAVNAALRGMQACAEFAPVDLQSSRVMIEGRPRL